MAGKVVSGLGKEKLVGRSSNCGPEEETKKLEIMGVEGSSHMVDGPVAGAPLVNHNVASPFLESAPPGDDGVSGGEWNQVGQGSTFSAAMDGVAAVGASDSYISESPLSPSSSSSDGGNGSSKTGS